MKSTTYVNLDLQRPNFQTVYAVQNDLASRWITATIRDGTALWEPPAGVDMMIRYRRADGVGGWYDVLEDGSPACIVNPDNTVSIGLAQTALEIAGTAQAEINFYSGQSEKLTTAYFTLQVIPSVFDDATIVTTEPYINVLSQQIADVLEAAGDITGLSASAESLQSGALPTVTVTGGTGGTPYNLHFGIPAGPPGPVGPTGNNYPVGSLFATFDENCNPATVFGGSWARLKGAYLYAADDGDTVDPETTDGTGPETVQFSNGMAHIGFGDSYTQKLYMERAPGGATFTAGNKAPDSGTFQWTGASDEVVQGAALSGSQTLNIEPTRINVYVWYRYA